MPLFFFHVYADGNLVEDLEGSELPDLAAAYAEAHASARDLISELIKAERVLDGQRIEVADAAGTIVASVPLINAVFQVSAASSRKLSHGLNERDNNG